MPPDPAPPAPPHALTPPQALYLWLSCALVTALLLANLIGVKLFRFEIPLGTRILPVEHTVGMLVFPVTFLLTDLVNEYYGRRATRRIAYVAFAMSLVAWALLYAARRFPTLEGIPGTADAASFENVFGAAALMYLASIVAFLLNSLLDIYLFARLKRLTRGRYVWLRATGSTVVSQLFDSFAITFLFFVLLQHATGGEPADAGFVLRTALTGYALKFVLSVLLTPVIYAGRFAMHKAFGLLPLPPEST